MANWGGWVALVGGIIAGIGQWYPDAFLPVIGGIIAIIGAIGALAAK
ncbi:hypothetical protein J4461_02585 [Candidatus Pacearchaeota archaeon]|nr:hypothetical protein [Candidatus Pacearchaeota archaeon]